MGQVSLSEIGTFQKVVLEKDLAHIRATEHLYVISELADVGASTATSPPLRSLVEYLLMLTFPRHMGPFHVRRGNTTEIRFLNQHSHLCD